MKKGQAKLTNHFFLPEDQRLFDYDQIFAVSSMWVELGMKDVVATYDLSVRGLSDHRNFLLFGGLEEIITSIQNWKFTKDEVNFLLKNKIIGSKMAKLLLNFKYTGDIWAMPEGTIFFSNEPVVRLTAPIWQINIFTFFLINALTSNTLFLSKIARSTLATQGKFTVVTCPVTRAHANEASLKFGRAAYMLGSPSGLVPAFARKFNIPFNPTNTKAYHAFIKSFPTEIEAMRAAAKTADNIGLMIDTYDSRQGIKNAITVGLEMKKEKRNVGSLVIDSGKNVQDFIQQAKYTRRELDKAGLKKTNVVVTGNFEEKKILKMAKANTPISGVIACTELVTSADAPKLETVIKLAEFKKDNKATYSAKLTPGKESYPGKKQVFRIYNKKGKLSHDVIGLDGEKLGKPLLKKIMVKGKLVYKLPDLDSLKKYTLKQLELLPNNLRDIEKKTEYKVLLSKKLKKIISGIKKKHIV